MEKSAQAFRTISEVAQDLELPQHVLRFWETRFVQIRPLKRGGGRRYYRPEDIDLLRAIRQLLYGEGYTIKGVQKILKEQGARTVSASYGGEGAAPPAVVGLWEEQPDYEDEESDGDDLGVPTARDEAHPEDIGAVPQAIPRTEAQNTPVALGALPRSALVPADYESLREILGELVECSRILDAARGG